MQPTRFLSRWWRGKLSRKLVLTTLFMIVAFLTVQGYLCYWIGKQALIREIVTANLKLANVTARSINAEYGQMVRSIQTLHSRILRLGKDMVEKAEIALDFRLQNPAKCKALYFLDKTGAPLLSLDDPYVDLLEIDDAASLLRPGPSEPPQEVLSAYERAAKGVEIVFSEAMLTGLDRIPKLHVGIPLLYGDEQEEQYLVVVIDLSYLWGIVNEIYLGGRGGPCW
ncbi:MAG: cache domain-containing protein [Deltaproteobacteria bacterium]|nr:cache domain-containing protein [Deltaproteobacteria bacterium]